MKKIMIGISRFKIYCFFICVFGAFGDADLVDIFDFGAGLESKVLLLVRAGTAVPPGALPVDTPGDP